MMLGNLPPYEICCVGLQRGVVLLMATVLVGCSLGHKQFKRTTEPFGNFLNCTPSEKVFLRTSTVGRLQLIDDDGLTDRSLISNVCLGGDERKRMSLAVIEFDDEGSHWDSAQLTTAKEEVRRITNHMVTNASKKTGIERAGVFLVVYVHGWKHNASETREALSRFRWFVSELAKHDDLCVKPDKRFVADRSRENYGSECEVRPHVFGVYVSWRGDALGDTLSRVPGLEALTFWNRNVAARRVASSAMTETLLGLFESLEYWDRKRFEAWESAVANEKEVIATAALRPAKLEESSKSRTNSDDGSASTHVSFEPPQRSRSLVIGHSMGALILEHAFAQAFLAKRVEARRLYGRRLLYELDGLKAKSKSLVIVKSELDSLEDKRRAAALQRDEQGDAILEAKSDLIRVNNQLSALRVSNADRERLRAYFNVTKPKVEGKAKSCKSFSSTRVKECTGDSHDLKVIAFCADKEVRCIYDSHRCAVERLISTASEGSSAPRCTSHFPLMGGVTKKEDIADWEQFRDDLTAREIELATILVDPWGSVPIPNGGEWTEHEILNEENLFDGGVGLLAAMSRWLGKMKPRFFAPSSILPPEDATEEDEEALLRTLLLARQEFEKLRDQGRANLAAVRRDWQILRDERRYERELLKERLAIHKIIRQAKINKLEAERERVQFVRKISEKSDELNGLAFQIRKSAAKVPFELDGALHPPGDVVLLLNAASEAMSARNLILAMCRMESESTKVLTPLVEKLPEVELENLRRPWIVSATSEADWATKSLFPVGVKLSRILRRAAHREMSSTHGKCDEDFGTFAELVSKTTGHHERLFSHVVKEVDRAVVDEEKSKRPMTKIAFEAQDVGYVIDAKLSSPLPRNYWVTQLPPNVIKGHGDVLTAKTLELVIGVLRYNQVFVSTCPRYNQNSGKCESIEAAIQAYQGEPKSE